MVAKNPAYFWYPKDYRADVVFGCSMAAQGLWRAMIDMMYLNDPRGYLECEGKPLADDVIAKFCSCKSVEEYRMLLAELRAVGRPRVDERGIFYSKRLLEVMDDRETYRRQKRAQREGSELELKLEAPVPIDSKNGRKRPPAPGFEDFYAAYPNKPGPAAARKVWLRRVKLEDVPRIMASLEQHKQSAAWLKDEGQYIPLPSTWLEQRRWEAEFKAPDPHLGSDGEARLRPWEDDE